MGMRPIRARSKSARAVRSKVGNDFGRFIHRNLRFAERFGAISPVTSVNLVGKGKVCDPGRDTLKSRPQQGRLQKSAADSQLSR